MTSLETTQVAECAYMASKVMQIFFRWPEVILWLEHSLKFSFQLLQFCTNRHIRTLRVFLKMRYAGFSGNRYTNIPKRFISDLLLLTE